jgi:hypothetical protein
MGVQVVWEDLGSGMNRKLSTLEKSKIILHEEFGSKKVIEEYAPEENPMQPN